MKVYSVKKIVILILVMCIFTGIIGCGKTSVNELSLVSPLTMKDVVDFYTEDIKFTASYESRDKTQRSSIEKAEISDKKTIAKISKAYEYIEEELKRFNHNEEMRLTKNQYEYIKNILDDVMLEKNEVLKLEEGSGYYFVDVAYIAKPIETGIMLDNMAYLGMHGAFIEDLNGNISLNYNYINLVNQKIIEYDNSVAGQKIGKEAFNNIVNQDNMNSEEFNTDNYSHDIENLEDNNKVNEDINNNNNNIDSIIEDTENINNVYDNKEQENNSMKSINYRKPIRDIKKSNRVAGRDISQLSIMPSVFNLYAPLNYGEVIAGYGIYPKGKFSLGEFGYDRENTKRQIVMRYVFKEDLENPEVIDFIAVYPVSIKVENNLDKIKKIVVTDLIKKEISKIVERADRAIMNNDITALMSSEIYPDVGPALLYGTKNKYCYTLSNYTKVEDIIAKQGKKYLISFSQVLEDGVRGTGHIVKYDCFGYMVIEQEKEKFRISDFIITDMNLMVDPEFIVESTYIKRLIALSSGGKVSDENKDKIDKLMQNLYSSSTERKLKEMYDCFNDNEEMLTIEYKEYLNSRLRGWLTNQGTNIGAIYEGKITTWIAGNENQAEIITKEKIVYDNGRHMELELYYLVSNYKHKWVIDDIKVIDKTEVK